MSRRCNLGEATHHEKFMSVWQDERQNWWIEVDADLPSRSSGDCNSRAQAEAHGALHRRFAVLPCDEEIRWVVVPSTLGP